MAKNALHSLRSQRGVGLPGMLVATGLGGVLALAMASLMTGLFESQNAVMYRSQVDTLSEEVRALLSSPTACLQSMSGINLTASTNHEVTALRDASPAPGAVIYNKGAAYGDRSLSIADMHLKSYVHETGTAGWATLELNYLSEKKAAGPERLTRNIRIKTQRDGSNNLVHCVALAKMSDGIWQRTPANQNNIFFQEIASAGYVGIKTDTPKYALSVHDTIASRTNNRHGVLLSEAASNIANHAGALLAFRGRGTLAAPTYPVTGDTLGEFSGRDSIDGFDPVRFGGASMFVRAAENFSSGRKGSAISFSTTPMGSNIQTERVFISANGEMGIGTGAPQAALDVNGAIKIGTASACDAAKEGTMRYSSTIKSMEFCDGANWKSIPSANEIRCYGQGGALNAPFPNPSGQCNSQATTSCGLAPNCVRDQVQHVTAAGYTACTWSCRPTP